jgi:hypothetical protein
MQTHAIRRLEPHILVTQSESSRCNRIALAHAGNDRHIYKLLLQGEQQHHTRASQTSQSIQQSIPPNPHPYSSSATTKHNTSKKKTLKKQKQKIQLLRHIKVLSFFVHRTRKKISRSFFLNNGFVLPFAGSLRQARTMREYTEILEP